jgi:phage terminase small subunit
MTDKKTLTKKQELFVDAYLRYFNATEAARRAGYKNNDLLHTNANKLLQNTTVKEAIDIRLEAVKMGADEVLKRLADIARGDIADFLDITSMGSSVDMAAAQAAGKTNLIRKIKQKTTTYLAKGVSGEDREVHETELELYSAKEALELIGKHHKLFNELGSKNNPVHIDGLDRLLEEVWSQ